MKRYFKIIGTFLSLTSLVACQDLGTKLPTEDGEAKYQDIIDYRRLNSPKTYTVKTERYLYNYNTIGDYLSESDGERFGAVNLDKLYYFVRSKFKSSYKEDNNIEEENYFTENWIYYKDGYLFNVINNQSKDFDEKEDRKTYVKYAMDKQLALSVILEENEISLVDYPDDAESFKLNITTDNSALINASKLTHKSTYDFYSKGGDGNLSVVVKDSYAGKQDAFDKEYIQEYKAAVLSYKQNVNVTFEKYHYTTFNGAVNLLLKDESNKELIKVKQTVKEKVTKGCTISYPKLDDFKEVTEQKALPF